jgi:hypothetical protein
MQKPLINKMSGRQGQKLLLRNASRNVHKRQKRAEEMLSEPIHAIKLLFLDGDFSLLLSSIVSMPLVSCR